MRRSTPFLMALLATAACVTGDPQSAPRHGIDEPSGITRVGDRLLIVGDDVSELCFIEPFEATADSVVPFEPKCIERVRLAAPEAGDLEGVSVLADGRIVALSEDSRALYDVEGLVARWDESLAEFGGRGLEGVAVKPGNDGASIVAVVWEGGYPSCQGLPPGTPEDTCRKALLPRLVVHEIPAGARDLALDPETALASVRLQPPRPAGEEPYAQRFRATAVVWRDLPDGRPGVIVLISSGYAERPPSGSEAVCPKLDDDGEPRRWCHKWMLRFDLDGEPYGEPVDLDDLLPEPLRTANWEGLGWWKPGVSLVLCYDEEWSRRRVDPQCVLLTRLPEGW